MRLFLLLTLFIVNCFGYAQKISFSDDHLLSKTKSSISSFEAAKGCTPSISTGAVLLNTICAGSIVTVPYSFTGCVDAGNVFTVELSDALGSF
jgi:hypothetical protein